LQRALLRTSFFRYILDVNGLAAARDYRSIILLSRSSLHSCLIAGRADIAMLPEPFVTRALMQNEELES
jgi:hypothetical protein